MDQILKRSACNVGNLGSIPGLGRSPGGEHGNLLQYSCLENPRGQRSLAGYSPWGHKESDTTEQLSTSTHFTISIATYYAWTVENWYSGHDVLMCHQWVTGVLIMGWPKSSFGFFHEMVQKPPNKLFGQANTWISISLSQFSQSPAAFSPECLTNMCAVMG